MKILKCVDCNPVPVATGVAPSFIGAFCVITVVVILLLSPIF